MSSRSGRGGGRAGDGKGDGGIREGGGNGSRKAASRASVPPGPAARARPARLTAAAGLVGLEGLALAALGVSLLVQGVFGDPDSLRQAETGGVTVLALAALPLAAARGLLLMRRWSRGPALITQIIALPVAWTLAKAGGPMIAAGAALAAAAVAVLVLLVHPAATEALGIGPRDT